MRTIKSTTADINPMTVVFCEVGVSPGGCVAPPSVPEETFSSINSLPRATKNNQSMIMNVII